MLSPHKGDRKHPDGTPFTREEVDLAYAADLEAFRADPQKWTGTDWTIKIGGRLVSPPNGSSKADVEAAVSRGDLGFFNAQLGVSPEIRAEQESLWEVVREMRTAGFSPKQLIAAAKKARG